MNTPKHLPHPFPNPRSFRPEHGPNAGLHIRKLRKFWQTICYFLFWREKPMYVSHVWSLGRGIHFLERSKHMYSKRNGLRMM